MARNYKRDGKGRFAKAIGSANKNRKSRKANKIERKYKRIDGYFKNGEMDNIKGTPLEANLLRRQARRKAQIKRLRG
ncbi:hypothetical protein [Nocardia phage P3.1]|nr:hypothetical protein [Nocardia phage P3.1]